MKEEYVPHAQTQEESRYLLHARAPNGDTTHTHVHKCLCILFAHHSAKQHSSSVLQPTWQVLLTDRT